MRIVWNNIIRGALVLHAAILHQNVSRGNSSEGSDYYKILKFNWCMHTATKNGVWRVKPTREYSYI